MPRPGLYRASSPISATRSKSGSTSIRVRRMWTTPAFSTQHTWSRRSDADVATEHLLVAEIRNVGADGAGSGGAARVHCDPDSDQRDPLQQPRRKRAPSVSRLHRPGVQESEVLRA